MKPTVEAQLPGVSKPGAFENVRLAHKEKMRSAFIEFMGNEENPSILEVKLPSMYDQASTGNLHEILAEKRPRIASYVLERGVTQVSKGAEPAAWEAGNKCLPYQDGSFDWVHCDGIIEQAGGRDEQAALIRELWRVARKGVFVTAQNKRHPIDFASGSLLLHWLRDVQPNKNELSADTGANRLTTHRHLVDAPALEEMAAKLPGHPSYAVGHVRHLGIKAHFFLMISKK